MSFNGSGTFLINTAGQPVVSGTVISSTAFNALTADLATGLSTCLTKDGQTTPTANIPMGNNKVTGLGAGTDATDASTLAQVQSTVVKLIGSVSGTNTITGSLTPALGAYAAGQMFYFVAAGDNTGAVTLNINSLGAKNVTKNGTTALAAKDIKSGQTVVVVYDGTRFQVVGTSLAGTTTSALTALGVNAGDSVTSGNYNTTIGYDAGTAITSGNGNTLVGFETGLNVSTASGNTYFGYSAGRDAANVSFNTFMGYLSGYNIGGGSNVAVGHAALQGAGGNSAYDNTAVGFQSLYVITSGNQNTAVGRGSGDSVTTGAGNTVVGYAAGSALTSANFSTAIGLEAMLTGNYNNSLSVGFDAQVTGANYGRIGDTSVDVYAKSFNNTSDARDKADIQDTNLGLSFIMQLQPRMYRWDFRESYRSPKPAADAPKEEWDAWREANKLSNLTHDGTHKRSRFHQGLVAQEVKAVMDSMGVDFGGFRDSEVNGGDAQMGLEYIQFIAPLIKAVQELKAEFDAYKATHP